MHGAGRQRCARRWRRGIRAAAAILVPAGLGALALTGPAGSAGALPLGDGSNVQVEVSSEAFLRGVAGVTVRAGGTASADARGLLVLPAVGGDVNPSDRTGVVDLDGATLVLQSEAGRVVLRRLALDLTFGRVVGGLLWDPVQGPAVELAGVPLFLVRDCAASVVLDPCRDRQERVVLDGLGLDWAGAPAQILADAFFGGIPRVRERDPFGVAFLDLAVAAPEPALPALLVAGLVLTAAARRARAR